ncbi:hypothetical protein [Pseudoalteromonas spongiae]|uniref:hypothetical protein n=1 Tax=Pseudoalteromonas spongiae TaxID=298657 RepID=UPI00026C9A4D|nr:hypothetical protein [Pseudoalteromonas spongiae]ATC99580.1 hypothetical protein PSPO_a2670 [Pseudoalteromonas spongiae UST010723-006]
MDNKHRLARAKRIKRYKNKYQPEDVAQWREFAYKTAIEMNRDLRVNTWFDENFYNLKIISIGSAMLTAILIFT